MVKQQMYLPLHGGPPVPIRGTPPRKAKAPRPRGSLIVVRTPPPPPPSGGMARRSTIATPTVSVSTRRSTVATPTASVSTRRAAAPLAAAPLAAAVGVKPAAAKLAASVPEPKKVTAPLPSPAAPAPITAPIIVPAAPPATAAPPAATPIDVPMEEKAEATASSPSPPGRKKRWSKKDKQLPSAMEPYDGLTSGVLREECRHRGISVWSEANQHLRHKTGFIQLLREDDQRRAAQQASAQIHKQDLEQIQLGSFETTSPASASNLPASPTTSYSFLSANASTLTPASAAAATAAVLYPPSALINPLLLPSPPARPEAKPLDAAFPPRPAATNAKTKLGSTPATLSNKKTTSSSSSQSKKRWSKGKASHTPPRSVRARRSCYVRLINVLLTPEFNVRWNEMNDKIADSDTTAEVNQFWLDVHVAFMSVNQLFDSLHFHDALFASVDPSVILAHEATRLRQMWQEVVKLYQVAVAKSKLLSQEEDETQSFFDSCSKRVDVLYMHMGLLLEPELSDFVLKMVPSTASQRSPPAKTVKKPAGAVGAGLNAAAKKRRSSVSPSRSGSKRPASSQAKPARPSASTKAGTPPKQKATTTPPSRSANPFSPVRPGAPGTAFEPEQEQDVGGEEQSYALVVSGELRDSAFETFAPHSFLDDGSGSSDYDGELPTRAMTPRKRRRHSEMSTDIVELHSSSLRGNELVAHTGTGNSNRMHHSALAVRTPQQQSSELMLPPDEWVILENRLRKVSESLDRCHRALSGSESQVSESHRMSIESDLRFYSAIKQRLQEQLLMLMQGF